MKRKHEEERRSNGDQQEQSAKVRRIEYKLTQGTVKLGHAFKIAKGFERQKLGRRSKQAAGQEGEKDVPRIASEIIAIKTLDNAVCARSHLYKSLMKVKAIAESDDLPVVVKEPPKVSADLAALNVHARLCNSNSVKDTLPGILKDVYQSMGVLVKDDLAPKKRRVRAKDYEDGKSHGVKEPLDASRRANDTAGESIEAALEAVRDDESGAIPSDRSEEALEAYEDRLAPSDSDDEANASNVEDLERQLEDEGIERRPLNSQQGSYDYAADLSLSEDDAGSVAQSPEPQHGVASKKPSFLPSLTMGGYISGSGSDIDDDIDEAPRKNRPGQRARQQIWEKKFGSKAKHLQQQSRNAGWDAKRGATDSDRRPGRPKPTRGSGHDIHHSKPANAAKENVRTEKQRIEDAPVHPSWAAAKRAKERLSAPVAFQGKKITF